MLLKDIQASIGIINTEVEVNNKQIFAIWFNRAISAINIQLKTAFPKIEYDWNDSDSYSYFGEEYIKVIQDRIVYDLLLSEEASPDLINQYRGLFYLGITLMKENMIIDKSWIAPDTKPNIEFKFSGITKGDETSIVKNNDLILFFINYDLGQLYDNGEIDDNDLLILQVPISLWKYLNNVILNYEGNAIGAKYTLTTQGTVNSNSYQVNYLIDLLYNGIVLKQHKNQINTLIFKEGVPSTITERVWKTK